MCTVIAARFPATILPLTAAYLATLAIESVHKTRAGRDGISYLINAKINGITTPLSEAYERELLRRTATHNLEEALRKTTASKATTLSS